ncbi:helix-turn-helix domain-containing protein [Chitinophaga ginsengisoli]|uniref:AraC-like DNA-binding protein n=1 Tax=Chitinophaga ginsengisoli TaxID=363837 RepID=A0A2P8FUF4_9BACT|nr:AraC family transcriptional regulator [Chitinophaga ginsengisoli]PSL25341.1 AraC-like DNA-binding protein [Chitinophaga ginsengisoli]
MMKVTGINSTYLIEEISPQHFIDEHYFMYVVKGVVVLYDGNQYQELRSGQSCIARKNRLGRYYKTKEDGELEKVILSLDTSFLKQFYDRHKTTVTKFESTETCIPVNKSELLDDYIRSLQRVYNRGQIRAPFSNVKREELLLILLEQQPELAGLFFDFGIPAKINLEEFMVRNYPFNVSIERFAFLTGRSISAFKRDFRQIFNETPSRWLVLKRLQEAYFLIDQKGMKPSDIYLDLGFETLSHFSFAFKKQFGLTPTALSGKKTKTSME